MQTYNDVLNELQDYILDDENIQKSISMKIIRSKNNKPQKKQPIIKRPDCKKCELFIPNQQDTLFWCFYIMQNGDAVYETTNNKNSLLVKQHKVDMVLKIRKHKDIIKMYKFDTISNVESNLANDNMLNTKTFLTLCAIENINVIYISKKTYFELLMNDSDVIYIVREIESQTKHYNKYGFEMGNEESINNIKSSLYKIDTFNKQFKAVTAYKVQDLIDICNRLAIEIVNKDTGKNKSKKDLYESIIQFF
jgi:hypothetical protein